jgi:hypothetical protein
VSAFRRSMIVGLLLAALVLAVPALAHSGTVATGLGAGDSPLVELYDGSSGVQLSSFLAYDSGFTGGVRVAAGDVNGDGVADVVTGAGPGGVPQVKVFDGVTGAEIRSFFAFGPSFGGGVYVAAGDVTGDGKADIVVGADAGGAPHVKVFDAVTGAEVRSFFAYDAGFAGGVRVAAGDVNGDGVADVVTGAGPGGVPQVRVFDGVAGAEVRSFFAASPAFGGGVYVAASPLSAADRTPPVLNLPGPLFVDATSPAGAVVSFTVSAFDAVDGPAPVTCVPASGSVFPI